MAKTKQKSNKKVPVKQQKAKKKKSSKKKYKVRNWPEYNEALKKRGALDVWIDEKALENWYAKPSGKKGAQPKYSDMAIKITLQFGKVFRQRLRQTEGLVVSLFKLMNVMLDVPYYSTLSRRGSSAKVKLPKDEKEKVTIVADSSGLKVYGEGEWKVRKHGYSKRRTWRKFHLAIDPDDNEIRAVEVTENSVSDSETTKGLINQEEADIEAFAGDGAYDTRTVYDLCIERNVQDILIPPQKNAKIWFHGSSSSPSHPRDANLRAIRKSSRRKWKEDVGCHVRSLSETGMFRFKTIFGDKLDARNFK